MSRIRSCEYKTPAWDPDVPAAEPFAHLANQRAPGGEPYCPYCGAVARLVTGADVYVGREDLRDKAIWQCAPCDARVGCHPNTQRPLGRLADAELRAAKTRAHAAFDQLWKPRGCEPGLMQRAAAYAWLACQLGLDRDTCHIGMFDAATCAHVARLSRAEFDRLS